jgi:hypothetical protein
VEKEEIKVAILQTFIEEEIVIDITIRPFEPLVKM